jgi:glyoxylase-like metal-dependent hydrolase (beta-lactamase superfamily II)
MSEDDEEPRFNLAFDAPAGSLLRVSGLVRRMVAPNAGPFTFTGTCSYVLGSGEVAVVDPGPENPDHVEALLAALGPEKVTHILVTHTHRDHSPAARLLKAATGAEILGCAPHAPARELALGETNKLDAANDTDHAPDHVLGDGEIFRGPGFTLRAVATPGHTTNHLCFELAEEKALFTGDHIMGWSTSIVAPPDGAMRPYMESLEKLRAMDHDIYWPGHGGPIPLPHRFLRALQHHRRLREHSILSALAKDPLHVSAIVEKVYEKLDPRLKGAAALTTLAHLEDFCARGLVTTQGPAQLDGVFALA